MLIDGQVIYTGDDWQQVFFNAARNPNNGTVAHSIDGKATLIMGPMVRSVSGAICPFVPPVQFVHMQHPAFIRGYKNGLATSEPPDKPVTDEEFVDQLRSIFEQEAQHTAIEADIYYGVGNLMGIVDAQRTAARMMPVQECLCNIAK